jgi:hypothetical protein
MSYLGNHADDTIINGAIYHRSTIIDCIVGSAAEAEYAGLYTNGQHAEGERQIIDALGYARNIFVTMCRERDFWDPCSLSSQNSTFHAQYICGFPVITNHLPYIDACISIRPHSSPSVRSTLRVMLTPCSKNRSEQSWHFQKSKT